MQYYVYMMTNTHNGVIYTGVTNDLVRRVYEHKNHLDKGSFTAQYNVEKLVYYEITSDVKAAIAREKQIKGWNRKRKKKRSIRKILNGRIYLRSSCKRGDCHTSLRTGSQ